MIRAGDPATLRTRTGFVLTFLVFGLLVVTPTAPSALPMSADGNPCTQDPVSFLICLAFDLLYDVVCAVAGTCGS